MEILLPQGEQAVGQILCSQGLAYKDIADDSDESEDGQTAAADDVVPPSAFPHPDGYGSWLDNRDEDVALQPFSTRSVSLGLLVSFQLMFSF